jgi:hypothetical protein
VVPACAQRCAKLIDLRSVDPLSSLQERSVQLGRSVCVGQPELWWIHIRVKRKLYPLKENRVVNRAFGSLPAKPPIPEHEL